MAFATTARALQRVLTRAGFDRRYGLRVESVADGECTLRVAFRTSFERPGGLLSGATLLTAADVAMWLAIMTRLGRRDRSVTSEMHTAFLAGVRREGFRCRARVVRLGRRLVYGTAECVSEGGTLLSHSTLTYFRPDVPAPGRKRRQVGRRSVPDPGLREGNVGHAAGRGTAGPRHLDRARS